MVKDKFVKYFHELTEAEFKRLAKKKPRMTWGELAEKYPQPPWCAYPDAVYGIMGCWSLTSFMVKDKKFCRNCELLIKKKKGKHGRK